MCHLDPAWHWKDAPAGMAETCKAGVGFGSSLSPWHLLHQLLHLGEDLLLLPLDTALQPLPVTSVRHLWELSMDHHQFVQQLDNLREKHVPLGDGKAHSASPQQEG